MIAPTHSVIDTRRDQMFPALETSEIERVRRFGEIRSYATGEALAKAGSVGHGLIIILSGRVDITKQDQSDRRERIVSYGRGSFLGELAQLGGRPALVDADAREPVEALVIAPGRKKLIMTALWTEACLTFPALDALAEGFEVFPVVDAVGGKPGSEALHKTCFPCHEPAKDRDFVFTRYAP
jgi:hypothetical protein